MNENYSVRDIITLLMNHICLIIVFSILGAAAGYGISKYVLPLKYASHITMYVQSYTDISENEDYIKNISYAKQLVNTYIEVLKDDTVIDAVGEQLAGQFDRSTLAENFIFSGDGKITSASIRNCLSISSVADTSAIKVTAVANNPEVAAFICNSLTKVAPEYMMEAVGVGSINTIGTAKTNHSPVAPHISKNTMTGGAAGFLLIVCCIFMIDFFDNTVKDSEALKNKYRKAIIGEIQQFETDDKKKRKDSGGAAYFKLTDRDIPFNIVESYKSIRTNVTFSLSTNEKSVFAVSSANPGEGVSTATANIAIAMAQSGSKVLLIDADMRQSIQHEIFGLTNREGLSAVLGKMKQPDKCIQKNVMENLDVMTAGPVPPNPSELLGSEQMALLLNELSSQYSIIIMDTPPVNVVTDALELAKCVSGIILVVRYGVTTDDDLTTASKRIESAKMNMLGFILNGMKHKQRKGYYSRNQRSGRYYYKKSSGNDYGYYGAKPEPDSSGRKADTAAAKKEKTH